MRLYPACAGVAQILRFISAYNCGQGNSHRSVSQTMKTPFDNDAQLVHGEVDIADSLTPPPPYGVYGIRWPYRSFKTIDKLIPIRLLLWSCMDRRVIRPVYERALSQGYAASEILLIAMGGGPVQTGDERVRPLRAVFGQLSNYLPNLEKIWAVAHTQTCGGIKYMCGGRPLTEALKPELKTQAADKGIEPELYATQLILTSNFRLLPEKFRPLIDFSVATPDEETQTAVLSSSWFAPDDAKTLEEIIT